MKAKKIVIFLLTIIIAFNNCTIVLAQNLLSNETQQENVVNEVVPIEQMSPHDLNEKREEVTNKIEESSLKLEVVKEELTQRLNEIAKLQESIDTYSIQVKQYREELVRLQNNIVLAETNLKQAEFECKKQEDLLTERLVAMYEAGDTAYLDFLLTSKNLFEFISNYYLIIQITEYDNRILDELERKRDLVKQEKENLNKTKIELKSVKEKAEQNETLLINTQGLQELERYKLNDEEKLIQEEIDKYRQEQYLIEEQIQLILQNSQVDLQFTGGRMLWPIAKPGTYITSYFGARKHPILGIVKKHAGLDIGHAGFGAPVVAAADGVVSFAGRMGGYGNCVMINHGNGVTTMYAHGQKILTELGATVRQGDLIMEVGSTGLSTGPHLHFEVRSNGRAVDPLMYLRPEENIE